MSGSITPGPSAGGRWRGVRARFWLLMAVAWVWVGGGSDRAAGTGRLSFNLVDCRECIKRQMTMPDGSAVKAKKMKNGWYRCINGHRYQT
jgi:hypothetical protein